MNIIDLGKRIDEILLIGQQTHDSHKIAGSGAFASGHLNLELFNQFSSASLSFILRLFGEKHPYYTQFEKIVFRPGLYETKAGLGILRSIKTEIDGGWLVTLRGLISSEIFADFLKLRNTFLKKAIKILLP